MTRRAKQAAQTRREIIEAARRRFVADGYGATTIASIAREAGVSVQTLYSSVGSKADLVVALMEIVRDEAGVNEHHETMEESTDADGFLVAGARMQRALLEKTGDIVRLMIETGPLEPDVANAWQGAMARSRAGVLETTRYMEALGALAPGLGAEEAAQRLTVLGHPQTYLLLLDQGWDHDRIETWLLASFRYAVFEQGPI